MNDKELKLKSGIVCHSRAGEPVGSCLGPKESRIIKHNVSEHRYVYTCLTIKIVRSTVPTRLKLSSLEHTKRQALPLFEEVSRLRLQADLFA